ncbi:MAG: flagellar motor protein MotB [Bdellovibrionales bacterium]
MSYGDMITLLLAFFVLFFSVDKSLKDVEILERKIKEEYEKNQLKEADSNGVVVKKKSRVKMTK